MFKLLTFIWNQIVGEGFLGDDLNLAIMTTQAGYLVSILVISALIQVLIPQPREQGQFILEEELVRKRASSTAKHLNKLVYFVVFGTALAILALTIEIFINDILSLFGFILTTGYFAAEVLSINMDLIENIENK